MLDIGLEVWSPLIYGIVAIASALIGLRMWAGYKISQAKQIAKGLPGKEEANFDNQIGQFIDQVPQMLMAIDAEVANLKKNGATKEQLASLESKAQILRIISQVPAPLAKQLAKPLAKKVLGMVKDFSI
jgi:uncharacterized protein YllA (UPF0747 family)